MWNVGVVLQDFQNSGTLCDGMCPDAAFKPAQGASHIALDEMHHGRNIPLRYRLGAQLNYKPKLVELDDVDELPNGIFVFTITLHAIRDEQ